MIIISWIIFVLCIFFMFRNQYTLKRRNEATDIIYKYVKNLMDEYDSSRDYYQEMRIPYLKYMFSLNLWGKYSCIKSEYKNSLL